MTAKQFFKSNVFKCLIALLCVLLVSGIFLTIMNGLLGVSEEEQFNRQFNKQVSKVYDGRTVTPEEQSLEGKTLVFGKATVEKMWLIKEENDYLVQSAGKGGYNGTLTCWVIIKMNDALNEITGIRAVSIYSYPDGELVPNISAENLKLFERDYKAGVVYNYGDNSDPTYVHTNASSSFSAICTAVNGALQFVEEYASGVAKVNPFEGFAYTENINTEKDTEYKLDGDGNVVFTVRTTTKAPAGYFTVKITVKPDGTIKTYEVIRYGSETGGGKTEADYNALVDQAVANYAGKDLNYFKGILGDDTTFPANGLGNDVPSGATYSNYLCLYAGAFATANYQTALNKLNAQTENDGEVTV